MMKHKIENLTIERFRQISNLELDGFGRINLFVGANNSGKTSLLEAIACFSRPLDSFEWLSVARRRNIKSSRVSTVESFRWLFPQYQSELDDPYFNGELSIKGEGLFSCKHSVAHFDGFGADDDSTSSGYEEESHQESDEELEESGFLGFSNGADVELKAQVYSDTPLFPEKTSVEWRTNHFSLFEGERLIRREPPQEPYLPLATVSPFAHRVEQLQVKQLTEATLNEGKFAVLECVNLIDRDITGLEILSRRGIRPTLWVKHQRIGYAPIHSLGDGVRRILTIALSLFEARDGILLIDEIETAIHSDALERVFSWLTKAATHFGVQLFATTHSLEAIDAILAADKDNLGEINGFRLERADGAINARRYAGELLHRLRYERALDVR